VTLLLSDRALLDAFRRGERRAIERVYHCYLGQVVSLLRRGFGFASAGKPMTFRGLHDAWELECAVQDVFSRAFSADARLAYDGISPYGPYLLTIARNWAISRERSEGRERRRRDGLAAEGAPPGPDSPEEQALRAELRELVARFRGTLTAEQQRFLDARYGEDRSLLEAARVLGLSRMQARSRDQRLREAFVEFLRREGYLAESRGASHLLSLLVAA